MFISETNESLTVGELIELLKNYSKDSIVLFQDLKFNSSKKEPVNDIIIRNEEYLNHGNKKSQAIILLNKRISIPEVEKNEWVKWKIIQELS